jgi:hypothetical protein
MPSYGPWDFGTIISIHYINLLQMVDPYNGSQTTSTITLNYQNIQCRKLLDSTTIIIWRYTFPA